MKKILYTLLALLFVSFNNLEAQKLKGQVTDDSNLPISDAYIYIASGKQHAHHSHSNGQGRFELDGAFAGDTVTVSFLGFESKRVVIDGNDIKNGIQVVLNEEVFDLESVSVSNSVKEINTITAIDLISNPVRTSQDVLRRVPGLFIGQHAGGGKAEQIFLRGFDIDHGTDITISVDGMPVNMVSHAHGQGYADLHFLIPETIQNIDFGKGPYYTDQGNFNTAGYVEFKTKDKLEQSRFGMEFGQFNTFRTYGLFDLLKNVENQHAYIATEYQLTDGPVESPQNFKRFNIMGKYTIQMNGNDRLSVLFSRFQSKWDASGQIPQRLVDNGTISRFGFVDNTEGGNTSRTNIAIDHTKSINPSTFVRTKAYYSQYDFELYSNFTFFLEDPVNGDQIRQVEDRNIYGASSTLFQEVEVGEIDLEMSYGIGLRYDDVNNNELSRSRNRQETLQGLALGNVDETNIYGFVNSEWEWDRWLINAGLRFDYFSFDYQDLLQPTYTSLSQDDAIVTPKLNIIYNPNAKWQIFVKSGIGFHSNDTRVVVAQQADQTLPGAYGVDVGTVWKPVPRLWVSTALWYLFLEQEFVYVGDAAIVEPSGRTVRQGIDFSLRYQLTDYLYLDGDINYTNARATEEEEGSDRIPLAPELTSIGGLTFQHPSGFSGSLRYRYIRDRAANEDNSIIAEGYFITDLNLGYQFKNVTLGVTVENLFDQDWNEAQFATESQLRNEPEPVEELHFTPGVPFFVRGNISYSF